MTEYSFFKGKLILNPLSVFFVTFICIIDRTRTAPLFLLASFLHEAGHIAVMLLTNEGIKRIKIGMFSVTVEKNGVSTSVKEDFLVSAAGIFVNALVFLFSFEIYRETGSEIFKAFAAVNIFVGGFNALPLSFLDGGELLHDICVSVFKKNDGIIEKAVHILTAVLGIIAGSMLLYKQNYFYALMCFYPAVLTPVNKIAET